MSATRLLVLGAVVQRGAAHGYQVRKDLESWRVDLWGAVGQGSIYHALKQLTSDGLLEQHDEAGSAGPARTRYSATADGRTAFVALLERTLAADGRDPSETMAAIGFMTALTRDRAIALLTERVDAYSARRDRVVREHEQHPDEDWAHHVEAIRFWAQTAQAEISWTEGLIAALRAGEHRMADD